MRRKKSKRDRREEAERYAKHAGFTLRSIARLGRRDEEPGTPAYAAWQARAAEYETAAGILERAEDVAASASLAAVVVPEKRPAARAPLRSHAWRRERAVAPKRAKGVQKVRPARPHGRNFRARFT